MVSHEGPGHIVLDSRADVTAVKDDLHEDRHPLRAAVGIQDRMNILLWVLQVLLALDVLPHGGLLLFPPAAIADQMNAALPRWFWIFLGIAEVLAAVGLTLPGVTRI